MRYKTKKILIIISMICVVGLVSGCIGLKDQLNPTFESTYMTPMCQSTFYKAC
jgi:hypothetical protein